MSTPESNETRLLRLVMELLETVTADTAILLADADTSLRGFGPLLMRLSVAEIKRRVMDGAIDLYKITGDELEVEVANAVALAASKISQSRLMKAPGSLGRYPQAPANDNPVTS
jgi:hypothetical protein